MANREACELYIEQEIEDGLEQGKKPHAIGKELSEWVAGLFEVNISPHTLKTRAYRQQHKNDSNESLKSNPPQSQTVPETITATEQCPKCKRMVSPSQFDYEQEICHLCARKSNLTNAGGKRKGAGRKRLSIEEKLSIVDDEYMAAHDLYFNAIRHAKKAKFKTTSKEVIAHHLKIMRDLITY